MRYQPKLSKVWREMSRMSQRMEAQATTNETIKPTA